MSTITVILTPTGNPNEFNLELPTEIIARHQQMSRSDAATIESELVDTEIGFQEDTQQLVIKTGGGFLRTISLT
jgi:hypothetical protein